MDMMKCNSGEVESPTTDNKCAAFAQAGIYAVGSFANMTKMKDREISLPSIVLYKDYTASIGLASLTPTPILGDELTLGKVSFEYVDSPFGYDTKDMRKFASVFVGVLQYSMQSFI